eukprot:scaffold870_cov393-Prasinococcus_capsulatus_cf.AAC.26
MAGPDQRSGHRAVLRPHNGHREANGTGGPCFDWRPAGWLCGDRACAAWTQLGEEYCDLWQVTREDRVPSRMRRWMFVLCHTIGPLVVRNLSSRARRQEMAARLQEQADVEADESLLSTTLSGDSSVR